MDNQINSQNGIFWEDNIYDPEEMAKKQKTPLTTNITNRNLGKQNTTTISNKNNILWPVTFALTHATIILNNQGGRRRNEHYKR